MGKRVKISLKGLGPYLIGAFAGLPIVLLLMPPSGTDLLPGWPAFIQYAFCFVPMIILLPFVIVPILRAPLNEKFTKRRKQIFAAMLIVCNLVLVVVIAMFAKLSFFGYQKVDRYITSPNGKNKAVVLSMDYAERICPVRKRFFYEDTAGIFYHPGTESIAFAWLDDDTLEITRTWGFDGEISTDIFRW